MNPGGNQCVSIRDVNGSIVRRINSTRDPVSVSMCAGRHTCVGISIAWQKLSAGVHAILDMAAVRPVNRAHAYQMSFAGTIAHAHLKRLGCKCRHSVEAM